MARISFPIPGSCKLLVCIAVQMLLSHTSAGQKGSAVVANSENYSVIFGKKYSEACTYLVSNPWIFDTIKSYGVDPVFATAIIFPELIRYSGIRNQIEMSGLFTLYVQYGQKYADFSVGRFQMKPTFAKQLETDLPKLKIRNQLHMLHFDLNETEKSRLDRVRRLDSPLWQVKYLVYFIKVMDARFAGREWSSSMEKVQFYAAAYNAGYVQPEHKIKEGVTRKTFYTTMVKSSQCYCYSAIACSFFQTFTGKF